MRIFIYLFVSYLVKDIFQCTPLEVLHHVAGSIFSFGFLLTSSGAHAYMTGCVLLEFGNVFRNLSMIVTSGPYRVPLHLLAVVVFICVHIPTLWIVTQVVSARSENDSTVFFYLVGVASLVVIALRQKVCYEDYLEAKKVWALEKAKKKAR